MVDREILLPVAHQCELLALPRSTFYHVPKPVSEDELELMHQLGETEAGRERVQHIQMLAIAQANRVPLPPEPLLDQRLEGGRMKIPKFLEFPEIPKIMKIQKISEISEIPKIPEILEILEIPEVPEASKIAT